MTAPVLIALVLAAACTSAGYYLRHPGQREQLWRALAREPARPQPARPPGEAVSRHPSHRVRALAVVPPACPDGEPLSNKEAVKFAALWFAYKQVSIPEPRTGGQR